MPQPISKNEIVKWKEKINQQKASGKSILAWCRENQIYTRSFYYWRSKLFPKIIDRSCFTELVDDKNSNIMIDGDLPKETTILDVPEDQKICKKTGLPLVKIE